MIERYTPKDIGAIWTEESKFQRFLKIEILVCEALAREGRIPQKAAVQIRRRARISIPQIKRIENKTHHDIVAFVLNLSQSLGGYSRYLHLGLTSSDILDTTLAWQLKDACRIIRKEIKSLMRLVKNKAYLYKNVLCLARTHGMQAEPYSFGLKFVKFYDELQRALAALDEAEEKVCCGKISGAVGTFAHISPKVERFVCKKIGIKPASFSTQIVSRDRIGYLISALAVLGTVMESFAQEIRALSRSEIGEVQEPFYQGQKGSSAMPHKRNPILCERICGLSRLLRGNLGVALENIALWHERDISHSSAERVIIPDSTIIIVYMLRKMQEIVKGLVVDRKRMRVNLEKSGGLIYSQKILLALMEKGLGRPEAYDLIQKIALSASDKREDFAVALGKNRKISQLFSRQEIEKFFDPSFYLKNVDIIYRKAGL